MTTIEVPKPNLADLPVRVDRETGAKLLSKYFFALSPRTLERWPLTWRRLNGKAHCETAELFAIADTILAKAPPLMGGRRVAQNTERADEQHAA